LKRVGLKINKPTMTSPKMSVNGTKFVIFFPFFTISIDNSAAA